MHDQIRDNRLNMERSIESNVDERFAELVEYARDRPQSTPRGQANHADDHDPSLMGMPPEVRNMTYRNLLICDGVNRRTGSAQILRCNRQINGEGTSILDEENEFVVEVWQGGIWTRDRAYSSYIPSKACENRMGISERLNAEGCIENLQWPALLLKAASVTFRTQLDYTPQTAWHQQLGPGSSPALLGAYEIEVNHILYSICSFLSAQTCLRSFEIDLRRTGFNISQGQLDSVCYPLLMLGGPNSLTIHSTDGSVTQYSHAAYATTSISIYNHAGSALLAALPLLEEANAYQDLAEIVILGSTSENQCPTEWTALFDATNKLVRQLNGGAHVNAHPSAGGMYDSVWEQHTRTVTANLQQALDNLHLPGLFPRHGQSYQDVVMALVEWRRNRMAFRAMDGMLACAHQGMTAAYAVPLTQPNFNTMSDPDRYEWHREQAKTRPLESSLALLVIRRKVLQERGLINDFEASRYDDKSDWLPPDDRGEEEEGEGEGNDEGEAESDDEDHMFSDSESDETDGEEEDDETEQSDAMEVDEAPAPADEMEEAGESAEADEPADEPRRSSRARFHTRRSTSPGPGRYKGRSRWNYY